MLWQSRMVVLLSLTEMVGCMPGINVMTATSLFVVRDGTLSPAISVNISRHLSHLLSFALLAPTRCLGFLAMAIVEGQHPADPIFATRQ